MIRNLRLHKAVLLILGLLFGTFAFAAPAISTISPTVGPVSPVGSSLTINGSGFGASASGNTVTIGGVAATPTSWSDTKIVVPIPGVLLPGFADVIVTSGSIASNSASFLVIPVITNDSPASGPVGTSVVISGTSFGDTQGDSTVTFNGVAAFPTSWSNTSLTVSAPTGATTGGVVVTVNGFETNGATFQVLPNITAIGPTAGLIGSSVTISGTTFGQTQGFGGVTFNGVSANIQSWSDSSITVLVPSGATSGNVVVTDHQLLASNAATFTVTAPGPTISSLNPSNGPVGTRLTISGAGFGSAQGTVSIGGANAAITSWSDTQVAVTVPDEALSGAVLVIAQGVPSNQATFQISPPLIQSIGFPFGGPGVERTIFGANFGNIPRQVTFNGVSAQVDVWSDTRISVFIPDMQRTGPVIVSAHGEESNAVAFNFVRAIRAVGNTFNLFITPDEATLVAGESHRLRLIDAQGVEQTTGVTWSVDDQQVAQIIVDNDNQSSDISALAPGIVTITATSSAGSAKADYTVIARDSLGPAIPLWTVYPETEEGFMFTDLNLKAVGSSPDDPYVYLFDAHPRDLPQTVFGVRNDGSIKWKTKLNYGFFYVAATNDGGFIVVSDQGPNNDLPQSLRKYSPSNGSLLWEQNQFAGGIGIPAVANDDTIYVEEVTSSNNSVLTINGADGHFSRVTAPSSAGTTWNSVESYPNDPNRQPCSGNAIIPTPQPSGGSMIGPLVGGDGRAYVAANWTTTSEFDFDDCTWGLDTNTGTNVIFTASGQYTVSQQASIISVGPDGSAQTFSLGGVSHTGKASYNRFGGGGINFNDGAQPGVGASTIVPDGNGGVLVTWRSAEFNPAPTHLSEYSSGSVVQMPDINGDIVATSEDRVFISQGPNISAYNVPAGDLAWSIPAGQVWSATTDGGLVVNTADTDFTFEPSTLTAFDGNGQPVGTTVSLPNDGASPVTEEAALVGNDFGAMSLFAMTPFPPNGLGCALPNCNPQQQQAAKPGEFRSVQAAGQCKDGGFDTHSLGNNKGADPAILPEMRYAALMVPGTPAAYSDQTTAQIKVHLNNIKSGATLSIANDPNNNWISTISPTTIPAGSRDTVVTVTGHNDTDGLADSKHPYLVVSQNGHPALDAILDVKRMLTISVGLFTLHPTDGSELPTKAPAGTGSVEAELIKDVGRQTNILFTGQVHGIFDYALDFEDVNGKGLGYGDWRQGVGFANARLLGTLSTVPNIQQINAFYIQKFNPAGNTVGLTTTGVGPSVIRDLPKDSDDNVENVTAHELAHHLGADDFHGGKEDTNQLMYPNVSNPNHPNPCHLTRIDWQAIRARIPKRISTTINPDNTETVTGTGFGLATGTANYVTSTQTIPLQITSWSDAQIIVVLPPNVSGGTVNFATANGQQFQ
jgi:hypothetical protein